MSLFEPAECGSSGAFIPLAEKGAADGVATLDSGGKVPPSQMPPLAINDTFVVNSQAAMLALAAQRGDVAVRTDLNKTFILSTDSPGTLADWIEILAGQGQTPWLSDIDAAGFDLTGLASATIVGDGTVSGPQAVSGGSSATGGIAEFDAATADGSGSIGGLLFAGGGDSVADVGLNAGGGDFQAAGGNADSPSGIANAGALNLRAGSASTTSGQANGGAVDLIGGGAFGAGGVRTGGDVRIRAGGGDTANGKVLVEDGAGTTLIEIDTGEIGFYGHAAAAQPAAIADLGAGATLNDVITAFNSLLAGLRSNGVIAT